MEAEGKIPWLRVERRLENAENYWLATTRPDGRPHCVPIWGLWADGALWFWTRRESVKAKNLAASPFAVVHLESGDDVVIVEGKVEAPRDPGRAAEALAAYASKYPEFDVASERLGDPYYLRPGIAHAWLEAVQDETRSRWKPVPKTDQP